MMDAPTRSEFEALKEQNAKMMEQNAKMMELILQLKDERNQPSTSQYGVNNSSFHSEPITFEVGETDQIEGEQTVGEQAISTPDQSEFLSFSF